MSCQPNRNKIRVVHTNVPYQHLYLNAHFITVHLVYIQSTKKSGSVKAYKILIDGFNDFLIQEEFLLIKSDSNLETGKFFCIQIWVTGMNVSNKRVSGIFSNSLLGTLYS
ncbi:hypothetical protein HHI36_004116 [Cryptolaemus montrouzieri]|uniref:Uncharacterized protein n=1 Tax=Cryptolaemus montrouzieri TaxID=559131 RepID=A0ABD2NQJ3_9CUCU